MGLLNEGVWDNGVKLALWNACRPCPNFDAKIWRYDNYGTPMKWGEYGNRASEYGWEIDHIHPTSKGGSDGIHNLRALNWRNNAAKSAGKP